MDTPSANLQQEDRLKVHLSKVFALAVQNEEFFEQLQSNPDAALASAGLSLAPEELTSVISRLRDKGEISLVQSLALVRGVLVGLIANRVVAPPPPPPPPPPIWWPEARVVEGAMKRTKSRILANAKARPKARPKAKKRSVAKRKRGRR